MENRNRNISTDSDRLWYYPRFQASDGGLGTFPQRIKGDYSVLLLYAYHTLVPGIPVNKEAYKMRLHYMAISRDHCPFSPEG